MTTREARHRAEDFLEREGTEIVSSYLNKLDKVQVRTGEKELTTVDHSLCFYSGATGLSVDILKNAMDGKLTAMALSGVIQRLRDHNLSPKPTALSPYFANCDDKIKQVISFADTHHQEGDSFTHMIRSYLTTQDKAVVLMNLGDIKIPYFCAPITTAQNSYLTPGAWYPFLGLKEEDRSKCILMHGSNEEETAHCFGLPRLQKTAAYLNIYLGNVYNSFHGSKGPVKFGTPIQLSIGTINQDVEVLWPPEGHSAQLRYKDLLEILLIRGHTATKNTVPEEIQEGKFNVENEESPYREGDLAIRSKQEYAQSLPEKMLLKEYYNTSTPYSFTYGAKVIPLTRRAF